MRIVPVLIAAALASVAGQPVESQVIAAPSPLTYADLADLAEPAPVVAHVRVRRASALRENEAPGLRPGMRRFYVEADVVALIRGRNGLPPRVRYLVDLPPDSRGRAPTIRRGTEYILLAGNDPADPAELRLVAHDAQLPYNPADAARLRAILREASAPGAPPRITGVGGAFHVRGALPGQSETQIFLQTATGRPVSLNVVRAPGAQPRWSVALSEIVGQAAPPPAPDSLLWYRLACSLPATLPASSLADLSFEDAEAVAQDYQLVTRQLGRCVRSRR